jgi:hypothetical protein
VNRTKVYGRPRIFTRPEINGQLSMTAHRCNGFLFGDSAMLTREQLQQISASIDHALKVSGSEPRGLLRHLLAIASMEASQRLKSQPDRTRKAA